MTNKIAHEEQEELNNAVIPHLIADGCLPEGDGRINEASRDVIRGYIKAGGGSAWLGQLNFSKEDEPIVPLWEAPHAEIYNWAASFVIPNYDAELEKLIQDRHNAPYTGTAADAVWVDKIFNRVEQLGGTSLIWT